MAETVEELKKEAAESAARRKLFADVAAKEKVETKKARMKIYENRFVKALTKKQPRTGAGAGRVIRKAITMASGMGGVQTKKTGSKTGKRGRPTGTYKIRYLPSGRAVKVPTHIYKKMLAAEKTQIRLAQAQRQQMAEAVAMQQDPRFQPGAEEQFLAEQDPAHEMNVARAQAGYPIQVQEQSNVLQRAQGIGSQLMRGISNISGVRARQEQVVDQYGRTMPARPQLQQQRPQPQGQGLQREPQVSLFSPQRNILNAPSIFNNPGQSTLLLPRRRRIS